MKPLTAILFFLSSTFPACIFAQNFEWAQRAGLYSFDLGYGVGSDNSGNVYIAGKYEQNAYFGGTYVTCAGNHDMYLAKYSPTGTFKWVRTAGGTSGDYAHAIAVDGAGNSYVTGEIELTVHFGSATLTSNGGNDVFVAKYDTNGNLIWVKKLGGGTKSDKGLGICVVGSDVYIAGKFEGQANFAGTTLTSAGDNDIFIAKYTTSGVFQWVKRAGGALSDEGFAISNDTGGNIYVTGYFRGSANFSGTTVTSSGGSDIFIAKYNSSGALLWLKKAGGTGDDAGNGIKVDNSGRIFVTGGFRQTSHFGSLSVTAAAGGHSDIFIARYDANGNAIWVRKAGGTENDAGRAIATDANGNNFITGNYGFSATFGGTTITGADNTELFFASYDVSGNFRWVLKAGGPPDASDPGRFIEMGLSICTDPGGNVFASGTYRSASTFGSTTLQPWSTHTQIFLTKIKQTREGEAPVINAKITPVDSASYCSGGTVLLRAQADSSWTYQWRKNGKDIPGATKSSYSAATSGAYSVKISRAKDSVVSRPTFVRESKSVTPAITSSSPVFCKDSNALLIANAGENYLYQWKRNGSPISGATASTYKPQRSGDYQVKIIQGSCVDWSAVMKVEFTVCSPKDSLTPEQDKAEQEVLKEDSTTVRIYPNPNKGIFTMELNMPDGTVPVEVQLVNAMGQVVYRRSIPPGNGYINEHIELDSSVPTGIYFLQIKTGDVMEQTRMMLCR